MASRIMVTGATGQIGSELTMELRRRYGDKRVLAIGHNRRPGRKMEDSGPYDTLDIRDKERLGQLIRDYDIDTIYHLAAVLSAVGEKDPFLSWDLNVNGLVNVLEVAKELGIRKVFWPSSIGVFGKGYPQDNTPQETVLLPSTIYGVAKVTGELLCDYFFHRFGLDVRSVRYPGIISADTPPGGGTTDYAVAIFYEAVKHNQYKCFVREDTVLPMMYMPDCLDAAIQIMEAPSDMIKRHDGYNINAMSFSAGDLARVIERNSPGFEIEYEPDFRQTIADSWPRSLDDSEARKDWGWKPKYGLEEMAKDMFIKLEEKKRKGLL